MRTTLTKAEKLTVGAGTAQ